MKLKDYLQDLGIPQATFARKVGVSSRTILNAVLGKEIRLSLAVRIEEVTKGQVKCKDLLPMQEKDKKSKAQQLLLLTKR